MNSDSRHKPRIGVFKFASCDGCQLSLLDAEDELLGVVGAVEIAYFPEASRAMSKGPYDIGLVEGSITTHQDAKRIQEVRKQCRTLITIGACATAGGIQALRNWKDVDEFIRVVYATPQFISTLNLSTPRMQAQGKCMHRCGPRCALSWAGNPGRVRRTVPELRSWLLRLLWTHGDSQYIFHDEPVSDFGSGE